MARKEKIIYNGPTYTINKSDNADKIEIEYKDVVYDDSKNIEIPLENKGYYSAQIIERLNKYLSSYWVNNYVIELIEDKKLLCHNAEQIPVVFRIHLRATKESSLLFNVQEDGIIKPEIIQFFHISEGNLALIEEEELSQMVPEEHFSQIKQICYKSAAILSKYFERRKFLLYSIDFEFGLLDKKVILTGELSPDRMTLKDLESNKYVGKFGLLHGDCKDNQCYEIIYNRIFAEKFQPEFERIKLQEGTLETDVIKEFEDELLDTLTGENGDKK